MTTYIDPVTGFQFHNNDPEPEPERTMREALEIHLSNQPGGITAQQIADLDKDFPPTVVSKFGDVGQGSRGNATDYDMSDHQQFLKHKTEILAELDRQQNG